MKRLFSLFVLLLLCLYSRGGMFNSYDIDVQGTNDLVIGRYSKLTLYKYNHNVIISWQCTLCLPEGVTLKSAYISGNCYPEGYNAELTTTVNDDGSVTLACKGEEGVSMTGGNNATGYNGNEIATVIVKVDSSVKPSSGWLYTTDVSMEEANGTVYQYEYSSYQNTYTIKNYSYNNNYTDQLLCTINGETSEPEEASASVTDNGNGTINLTLKNVIINSNDGTSMPLGNIKVENIPVTYGKDGLDYFSHNSSAIFEKGDSPDVDSWLGPLLGTNPIALQGKMNKDKLYVTFSLDMQSLEQVLSFQFGIDDFVPAFPVEYTLTYLVDGELYKTYSIVWGTTLTPEAPPTKEGYTFSGWSDIPETMPSKDITITGSFTINKYNLTYMIDGEEYKTYEVEYGTPLQSLLSEVPPVRKGMTFSGWNNPDLKTMPAKDVIVTGSFSWSEKTIDDIIYQVTDTLNNYAMVRGTVSQYILEADIRSSVEIDGSSYLVNRIGDNAFYDRFQLRSLTIPSSIISIGEYAFCYCAMNSLTIPDNVTSIGTRAFYSCPLVSLTIGKSITSISSDAFGGNPELETLTINCSTIYDWFNSMSFSKLHIGENVTTIGNRAFLSCYSLTSLTIPDNVTRIGNSAFSGCTGLTSVSLPNRLTSIGEKTFIQCFNLASVTIPNSVTSIGIGAFRDCWSLISIEVETGNLTYDSRNNCNAIIETATNTLIAGCQNTDIPGSVTSIDEYAFSRCTGLTSVTIPESVTSIGNYAFNYCSGLTNITSYIKEPFAVANNVFNGIPFETTTLFVPAGTIDAYKATDGWNKFQNIEKIPSTNNSDLNDDGVVDVSDIMTIINNIATDTYYAPADLNNDKYVDVGDIMVVINAIIGTYDNSAGVKAMSDMADAMPATENNDCLTISNEDNIVSIQLDNEFEYSAFQMLVTLPDGVDIDDVIFNSNRLDGFTKFAKKVNERQYIIIGFSMDGNVISGSAGKILSLSITGNADDNIVISDPIFSIPDAKSYKLRVDNSFTTNLQDIQVAQISVRGNTVYVHANNDTMLNIYSVSGALCERKHLHPGVNAIALRPGQYIINNRKVTITK